MNRSHFLAILLVACAGSCTEARAQADMKDEVDCSADPKLLDRLFSRYGFEPNRSIVREKRGVRFRLPAYTKDVGQTGIYSFFALSGDFEISASYELITLEPPKTGYGMSIGIALEAHNNETQFMLARGHHPAKDRGNSYFVTKKPDKNTDYDTEHVSIFARKGQLVIRREKKELVCLVADSVPDDFREIARAPFTDATVRRVRFYADAGGSPTALDGRLTEIRVKAEEITGGIPRKEQTSTMWWWIAGVVLLVGMIGYLVYRRRREEED